MSRALTTPRSSTSPVRTARRAVAATLGLTMAVLPLAGCSQGDATPEPSASASVPRHDPSASTSPEEDVASLESITVVGELGSRPTIEVTNQPFVVSSTVAKVVDVGTGGAIPAGSLAVVEATYFYADGTDAGDQSSTWAVPGEDEDANVELILAASADTPESVTKALLQTRVGGRLIFASRVAKASYIVIWDITGVITPADMSAGAVVEPADGLPEISYDESGTPSVGVAADFVEPTDLVVQPLIQGTGDVVTDGQSALVRYTGWLLDGGVVDSNWTQDTGTLLPLADQIEGVRDGLIGQRVGSRVLLVVPAEQAYGSAGTGTIPPDSTLIFVMDILAAR